MIVACSSINQIDKPVCVEVTLSKGYCTTIISGKDSIIDDENKLNGKTWFEARHEMVLVPIDTWAALKTYLITNCKRYNSCNKNIDSWDRAVKTVDDQIQKKASPASSEELLESHEYNDLPSRPQIK